MRASIFDSYPSKCGVLRHLSINGFAEDGGFFNHFKNVSCGLQADTTHLARISVPSPSTTPRTRDPSQSICATFVLVITTPAFDSILRRNESGTMPLPPIGRPTFDACRIA
ncbi:MAG: hypothetical protein EBV40_01145 [Actinobacteria bacterium]|nr:hypothetical protein [Actinomycetota bacterium]